MVVFKFEDNAFFTTKALYHKLQETEGQSFSKQRSQEARMLATLTFLNQFNKFMVHIQHISELEKLNSQLETAIYGKLERLKTLKEKKGDTKVKELREAIALKKKALIKKKEDIASRRATLPKIEKFSVEKMCDQKYYQEVFKAFRTKL